jgi:hypothetical protein
MSQYNAQSSHTKEIVVGPQGKINEGTKQVVHEGTSNWVKVTHAKSMKWSLDVHSRSNSSYSGQGSGMKGKSP